MSHYTYLEPPMSTAIATVEARVVTPDEIQIARKTIAKDATC